MKNLLGLCFALILISGCAKNEEAITGIATDKEVLNTKATSTDEVAALAGDDWIWVANQTNDKIEIYAPNTDWSSTASGILKFSWKPTSGTSGNGYSEYAEGKWVRPNDFKVRNVSAWGGNYLCAVGGGGLATIAAYPSGQKKWAYNIPPLPNQTTRPTSNPHGCELLPNGNIAVAATDIDSVLLFGSSTLGPGGFDNTYRAKKYLQGIHAVLWDPINNRLWAIGRDLMFELEVGGTAAAPTLIERSRSTLKSEWGHDLSIDLTNSNQMLYSTNSSTHIFNKTTKISTNTVAGLQKSSIKSISNQSSGSYVIARADVDKPASSKPHGSASEVWNTRYADLHSSTGVWLLSQTKQVSGNYHEFYKAKVFRTAY
jgi:hypothetical protein